MYHRVPATNKSHSGLTEQVFLQLVHVGGWIIQVVVLTTSNTPDCFADCSIQAQNQVFTLDTRYCMNVPTFAYSVNNSSNTSHIQATICNKEWV